MKKKSLLAIIILSMIIFACKKDDDNDNGGTTPQTNQISCKINGNLWSGSTVEAVIIQGALSINSVGLDSKGVILGIMDYNGVGTYTIAGNISNANSASWLEGADPSQIFTAQYNQGSGSVEITSVENGIISGTFSFVAVKGTKQEMNISDGSFKGTLASF